MVSVTGGRSVTSIDKIRRSDNVGVARLTWVPILGRRTPALRCRWSDRVLLEHERDWEALSSSLEVLDMDSSGAWLIRLRSFVGMEALRGTAGDGPPQNWGGVTARAYVPQYFAEILYNPQEIASSYTYLLRILLLLLHFRQSRPTCTFHRSMKWLKKGHQDFSWKIRNNLGLKKVIRKFWWKTKKIRIQILLVPKARAKSPPMLVGYRIRLNIHPAYTHWSKTHLLHQQEYYN